MQLVQFMVPGTATAVERNAGVIDGTDVVNLSAADPQLRTVYDLVERVFHRGGTLQQLVTETSRSAFTTRLSYADLLATAYGDQNRPYLIAPFDHPQPARLMISGTGLTHLGSVKSRDQMHGGNQAVEPQTDSARMFAMGLEGGRPEAGQRGVSPEWFYKGNGNSLRGPGSPLEIPEYALDGGEEPEIAGCYVIDPQGKPRQIGFVLGNEWSEHGDLIRIEAPGLSEPLINTVEMATQVHRPVNLVSTI